MSFRITVLDIKRIIETSNFRVDYIIENVDVDFVNVRFSIYDPFFNIQYIPGSIDVYAKVNNFNWVGFNVDTFANDEKPNFKFGFRLLVEDLDNGVILHDQLFKNNFSYNKENKTVWIFGDSHAWESFGGYNYNPTNISGYDTMRVSLTSLSLNRFIKGDYLSFVNVHCIKPEDCLVFYLGEIDFRHAIHKYCLDKSLNLVRVCLDLMEDYYKAIMKIKETCNNRIIIMAPNPPIADNFLSEDLVLGTEKERKLCWDIFDYFWKNKDIEYLDWTKDYKDNNGLIDISKLNNKDIHILDYHSCVKSLANSLLE